MVGVKRRGRSLLFIDDQFSNYRRGNVLSSTREFNWGLSVVLWCGYLLLKHICYQLYTGLTGVLGVHPSVSLGYGFPFIVDLFFMQLCVLYGGRYLKDAIVCILGRNRLIRTLLYVLM